MSFRLRQDGANRVQVEGLIFLIALLVAVFAVSGALAREKLPVLLQFSIQDEHGNFFYEGEIEFCTPDGDCVFADIHPGFPGHFFLPREALQPGVPYTVFVYDLQVNVLFEMRGWTYNPADYDPGYSPYFELNQFLIFPHFKAHPDRRLTFHLETTLNPEWKVVSGLGFADQDLDNLPDWPEFMASLTMPVMLGGHFTSNEDAAGGVEKVKLGLGFAATWRSKYPRIVPDRDAQVPFRELQATYSQNRYGTKGVYFPGRSSDVTFHRWTLSYGFGRMDQPMLNHWSVSGALSFGGIYDGGKLLKFEGRNYFMVGGGLKARYLHGIFSRNNLTVGLDAQLEWMFYTGGEEGDHWYGSAPAGSIGITVY